MQTITPSSNRTAESVDSTVPPEWCHLVKKYVDSMTFGQVVIHVHEGRVAQVEKTERVRFPSQKKP
ncbi:MAG: YezD family protein [Opitutales bacterium]|nr:YezD family protein [Opitutales bacterium]